MGFGCARFATLTIAPPHPKGAKQQGKKAIYRKKFTPALLLGIMFHASLSFLPANIDWTAQEFFCKLVEHLN